MTPTWRACWAQCCPVIGRSCNLEAFMCSATRLLVSWARLQVVCMLSNLCDTCQRQIIKHVEQDAADQSPELLPMFVASRLTFGGDIWRGILG